ncbi:MAG: beta-lactamase family protein [Gammaproteobacteria bacterium]|nr:beta-lactamase family protein [Gammaproteobacteria bacterium]
MRAARVPGIQYVAVDRNGVLRECHAGCADLATRRPMTADTTMMAFSMSKTVTALATLQLLDRGALSLDVPLARFVPWQPYGPDVTIRQLLCHTAGIPNPLPLRWVHPAGDAAFEERAHLDAVLRRHPRLASPPGTRYAYANIGYWLLGDATRALMQTRQTAQRGPIPMTLGWHIGGPADTPYFFKEGGGGGFHSMMRLYPVARVGSVVMTNATLFNVRALLDAADAQLLRDRND